MRQLNNLGGDNIYLDFRVYIEGVQVPFSDANISNVYRGLPTATVSLAPWRGFTELTKGYFPKIHIFARDPNQAMAPYDIRQDAAEERASTGSVSSTTGNSTETGNRVERNAYKLIFGGVITSVQDSKDLSGEGGSASLVLNCVHPYYVLHEILFKFSATNSSPQTATESAFGIMMDGNIGSLHMLERALAGVHQPIEGEKDLENGGDDISALSEGMADNYWRLMGMPGVVVSMWNALKQGAYQNTFQTDKSIMTKMYIPLLEEGLQFFTKMTGHPILEGAIQDSSRPTYTAANDPQEETSGGPSTVPQQDNPTPSPGSMTYSDRGKKELTEVAEGRRNRLYDDKTGKTIEFAVSAIGTPTIGVGHAVSKTDTSFDRTEISNEQIDQLFSRDVSVAVSAVNRQVVNGTPPLPTPLTQGQFDALVDLTFNVGPGAKGVKDGALIQASGQPSTIVRLLQEGNTQGAADGFMSWVYAGGEVSQGLVVRRARNRAMFLGKTLPSEQEVKNNIQNAKGSKEEFNTANTKLLPGNMNAGFPRAVADQIANIFVNDLQSGGTGETMSFGQFVDMFLDLIEYDHVVLNSPAALGVAGVREIIDHVYKPQIFNYYSPLCNVLLPHMYQTMSVSIGTDQVPSRVVYHGDPFSPDAAVHQVSEASMTNYLAPHSVRKALANGGTLLDTKQSQRATPGKYEWGTGIRVADGKLPYWYAILSQTNFGAVGDTASESTVTDLKNAWNKLYPEDPFLNPWDSPKNGLEAWDRLFVTGVDYEFSTAYSRVRQGTVSGIFNPHIVVGYPMDVIDPSPLRESYHGFCTSVNHSISATGFSSTTIGMSSCFTFSEIATCYIPGTYPWLLNQLHMTENLSMYGNTKAFQRACQFYVDVLGVGAADPTILESYSTGKPIPVVRDLGIWRIGGSEDVKGDMQTLYTSVLGNLNLVGRNIQTLLDVEKEHCEGAETFIDIDMWNQGTPTVQQIRKGPWVNDGAPDSSSTLRGRDMESSAFLDYDQDPETGDPIVKAAPLNFLTQTQTGESTSAQAAQKARDILKMPDIMPKLGRRCEIGQLDSSSYEKLQGCHPDLIKVVMEVIKVRPVVITSGFRSPSKQRQLEAGGGEYAQGAGLGSRHLKSPSWAVDMVPCNDLHASSRAVMSNFAQYVLSVASAMGIKLRWGGTFKKYDPVHFDLGLG